MWKTWWKRFKTACFGQSCRFKNVENRFTARIMHKNIQNIHFYSFLNLYKGIKYPHKSAKGITINVKKYQAYQQA